MGATKELTFDEMLPYIGEFGKFQIIMEALLCISMIPMTFPTLIMYFAALQPPWQCVENSLNCTMNGTFPADDSARCSIPRNSWKFTQPEGYSVATKFDIYCSDEWQIHMTNSLMFLGWGVGAVVLGWVADNYGRKTVLYPSMAVVMLVGFISAFSPNMAIFITSRVIVGFFIPATGVQMFVMISEIVGPRYRPAAGIGIWVFFTIGLLIMGLKAYLIPRWSILFMICTLPYIFVLAFYFFVPESIRWLVVVDKLDRAMEIVKRISRWNNKTIPDDITLKPVDAAIVEHKAAPADLFKTRKTAFSTLNQGYAWLVNGMVYYGLSLAADDLGGSLYTNYVLSSIVELPAICVAIYSCNRFGRKRTVIYPFFISGISCILVSTAPSSGDLKALRIFFGIFGKFCIALAFDSIYTWSVELFPTNIRALGMGFLQVTARIGAASAPWVAKALKALHPAAPFVTMGTLALTASVLLLWLPETKGKVEGTGDDGNGDEVIELNRKD